MASRRNFLVGIGSTSVASLVATKSKAEDWPQWRGTARDGRWHEDRVVTSLPEGELPLLWKVPIGPGYSGPVVSDGRVYVTDKQDGDPTSERVLCFDEDNGKLLWEYAYPVTYTISYTAGPRASVTVQNGVAYALGAMGNLIAFDAKDGRLLWQRDLNGDYSIKMPIWGISASPILVENILIAAIGGSNGASVIGLDVATGEERWRALDDRAQYSAPVTIEQVGKVVVVVWTGDNLVGLSPDRGKVYWKIPFTPRKMPIGVPTPVVDGDRIYLSSFYDGSLMVRAPKDSLTATVLWQAVGKDEKKTEALHSMIGTPMIKDGYIYGVDSYGQFRCLEAATGTRVWEDLTLTNQERWGTIHMVDRGEQTWLFNELGELIVGKLSPTGFAIDGRSKLIEPTTIQLSRRNGRGVCWSHPAFANRKVFARSDDWLVAANLAAG